MNKSTLRGILCLAIITFSSAHAQLPDKPRKPPVGVPNDATHFNGKWYRTYLEKTTWKHAQEKCRTLGGQLVCIPDAATQAFISKFSNKLELWLGATDEKVEGQWVWVDSTEMKYSAWSRKHPRFSHDVNYLILGSRGTLWYDAPADWGCVGFICEWKDK